MESNAIRHITSSPFHPRTSGKAARFVQSFKKAIKSASGDFACINKKLNSFLCKYLITAQATTNESPSILMYGRKPDLTTTVMNRQYGTKAKHCGSGVREFSSGDAVNTPLVTIEPTPKSGQMDVSIHKRVLCRTRLTLVVPYGGDMLTRSREPSHPTGTVTSDIPLTYDIPLVPSSRVSDAVSETKCPVPSVTEPRRKPPRNRKKPDRLNLWFVMSAVKTIASK